MLRAHSCKHGNSSVDVVVYDNLPFSIMITMQATDERCDDLVNGNDRLRLTGLSWASALMQAN
jgi:hypothetical protein